jgi:hypothetical protein
LPASWLTITAALTAFASSLVAECSAPASTVVRAATTTPRVVLFEEFSRPT